MVKNLENFGYMINYALHFIIKMIRNLWFFPPQSSNNTHSAKKKEISSEILCTCVASQLFTKHHGSGIYFPYLILLDSQFVMLNKMCTETLNIALQIFSEQPFVYCEVFRKLRWAHTSCHLELPINKLFK